MGRKKVKQSDKSKKNTEVRNDSHNDTTTVTTDEPQPSTSGEAIPPTEEHTEEQTEATVPPATTDKTIHTLDMFMGQLVENVQRCEITIKSTIKTSPTPVNPNERYTLATQLIDIQTMIENLAKSRISLQTDIKADIVFREECDLVLLSKWPRFRKKVPAIFMHEPFELTNHCQEILSKGINFYKPYLRDSYIKVLCPTLEDHIALTKYFDEQKVPYHTFGQPADRFLKLVIRGLPDNVDMDKLKLALRGSGIPLSRLHKMLLRKTQKSNKSYILVVVPLRPESKKILRIVKIFDHDVTIETPLWKSKQCHRCLRWGHAQRYCRGDAKCVKCAGPHLSEDCRQEKVFTRQDLLCANCFGRHAASYRWCSYCPDSEVYQMNQKVKEALKELETNAKAPPELVTPENWHRLYANLDYNMLD